ncbi:hypothetical protein AYI69_g3065 [Smittium culicis]|uniref:Uncharacterized protein n=1 Tax=Smittium culicis TaxID=133412 RepID=A0A1R1YL22_9FUNG|nr:hypothetical protein AYI69_g3065 [Smittium culicis]
MQNLEQFTSSNVDSTSLISENTNDINQYYAHMLHLASSFVHKALLHSKHDNNQEFSASMQKRQENQSETIESSTSTQVNLSENEVINTEVIKKNLSDIANNINNKSYTPTFESCVSESAINENIKIGSIKSEYALENSTNLETDICISSGNGTVVSTTGSLAIIETDAKMLNTPINNALDIKSIGCDPISLENITCDTYANGNINNKIALDENIENKIALNENIENKIALDENIENKIVADKNIEFEISAQGGAVINVDISENAKISNAIETSKFSKNSVTASSCIDISPTVSRNVGRTYIISAITVLDSLCVPNTPAPVERLARWQLALIYNKWSIDPKMQEKHLTRALLLTPICPNADSWKLLINISLIDLYISNKDYSFALNRLDEMINHAKE